MIHSYIPEAAGSAASAASGKPGDKDKNAKDKDKDKIAKDKDKDKKKDAGKDKDKKGEAKDAGKFALGVNTIGPADGQVLHLGADVVSHGILASCCACMTVSPCDASFPFVVVFLSVIYVSLLARPHFHRA